MIKIRPITAQINTQKFISNFSSLLARAGMASVEKSPPQPLGPPAPRSAPRETCSSPFPVESHSRIAFSHGKTQQPLHNHGRNRSRCLLHLRRGALSQRPLRARGTPRRWGGGEGKARMEMETSQDFALLDPENSTKREVSHPQTPERRHLKCKEAKI